VGAMRYCSGSRVTNLHEICTSSVAILAVSLCLSVLCGRPRLLLCVRCPMCRVHAVNATRLEYRIRQVRGVATGPRVAVLATEA
jgi:hypothetical protein